MNAGSIPRPEVAITSGALIDLRCRAGKVMLQIFGDAKRAGRRALKIDYAVLLSSIGEK
ncbi:MAG TPA: hypothetical protein VFS02_11640 [Telluria sp.]|nr:hypothetical protein [Telluria sp.]